MEIERHYLGAWDGVQRQGQGVLECFSSVAQGLGGILQSHIPQHIPPLPAFPFPSDLSFPSIPIPSPQIQLSSFPSQWPWSSSIDNLTHLAGSGFGSDMKLAQPLSIGAGFPESLSIHHLGQDVSTHVGQAGASIGAYLSDLAGGLMQRFPGPSEKAENSLLHSFGASTLMPPLNAHTGSTRVFPEGKQQDVRPRTEEGIGARATCRKESNGETEDGFYDDLLTFQKDQDLEEIADKEVMSMLAKNAGPSGNRSSAFVSTTFSSRTQDIETSVVARGDLWRVEATQGGSSTPLFLLQLGPILFVRASTLLLPIHLSKRHCLWYGFDRKEGLHSLCPAVWSKHRRWLAMAMLSLNPVSCSFLDLQFPNGQMTYVAGDGLTGSAFTTTMGGLLQVQGRFPGDTKISYSYKNKWGTRFTPAVLLPEKSASFEVVQPLAWQPLGVLVRPTVELSVTPSIGGRHPGTKVELLHSPMEKFSWGCGCVQSVDSKAFASVSVGRSKRNGEHVGSCGLTVQVESPVSNIRRTSFTVQLNSGVEI
ncbi:hypothetical protein KC19_7G076300 [Ceratodon purpureus]|uniref:Uncharacterized protein n=1 Tax=Ceratodon purpureus TaxID=3225 RepID=A0A8T0H5S0_CERPU|nr:hypothetical protein KC19_7G076300 [Ceratodon purpureus]